MPILPWSHKDKHTPEELLALATIKLKSARKESIPKNALKVAKEAKSNLDKAEKFLSNKRYKDPSLEESIANAYHEHGELLDKLGDFKQAQESHRKAKGWGYTHKVSEHTPSSQSSDKNISSNHSVSHLESLSPIPNPVIRNIQAPDPKIIQSSNDTRGQGTASSTVDGVKYTKSQDGHIPSNIFNKDGTLKPFKCVLPEIGSRVANTQQLVYCLGLLTTATEELEPTEQGWVLKIKENADEKGRLDNMANDMVRVFARDELKNHEEVEEVVWLAPHLDQQHSRKLLQILISGINDNKLLEISMVDGLVRTIRNARQMKFESDDL
ncbi:hypothetical protein BGZ46_005358, partial [Entomortierella lignicola]